MEVALTELGSCTKRLQIAVPPERVREEVERAYGELRRTVSLKGFRKGKVPRPLLERHHGQRVRQQVLSRIIGDSYREALAERGMQPVGEPQVADVKMDDGAPLTFTVTVEVIPPIELKPYEGLRVSVGRRPVGEAEVERALGQLREQAASYEDVDRPARGGDYVLVDYEAFEGGMPIPEARAQDQALVLGRGAAPEAMERAIEGMRRGEEKEVTLPVSEDAPHPALAGKEALFRLRLKEVKGPQLPALDDEFARGLGSYENLAELRERVRRELERAEEGRFEAEVTARVLDRLVEENPFEVPPTLVERQTEARVRELERRLREEGHSPEVDPEKLREELRPGAERRVRELILVERVRQREGLEVSEAELEAEVERLARLHGQRPGPLRARLAQSGTLESIADALRHNQTVQWLKGRAEVVEEEEAEGAVPPGPQEG